MAERFTLSGMHGAKDRESTEWRKQKPQQINRKLTGSLLHCFFWLSFSAKPWSSAGPVLSRLTPCLWSLESHNALQSDFLGPIENDRALTQWVFTVRGTRNKSTEVCKNVYWSCSCTEPNLMTWLKIWLKSLKYWWVKMQLYPFEMKCKKWRGLAPNSYCWKHCHIRPLQ